MSSLLMPISTIWRHSEQASQVRKLFLRLQDLVGDVLGADGSERRVLLRKAADAQADLKDQLTTLRQRGGAVGAYQQAAGFLQRKLTDFVAAQPEAKTTFGAERADTDAIVRAYEPEIDRSSKPRASFGH